MTVEQVTLSFHGQIQVTLEQICPIFGWHKKLDLQSPSKNRTYLVLEQQICVKTSNGSVKTEWL
jgi:hypothetical protein